MGRLRNLKEPREDLNRFRKFDDIVAAINLISKWVGKPVKEHEVVVRYSEKTGKPVEHKWEPRSKWDGRIYFVEGDAIYGSIRDNIPIGELVQIGCFIVEHFPSREEGGWRSGGRVPAYLLIRKPKVLK